MKKAAVLELGILGCKNHLVCICHMMHNFLKEIINNEKSENVLNKIRKIIKNVRKSVKTSEKF